MRTIHVAAFAVGLIALIGVLLPVAQCSGHVVSAYEIGGVAPLLYLLPFAILAVPVISWLSRGAPSDALYVALGGSGFFTVLATLRSGCAYLKGLDEVAATGQMVPGSGAVLMWLAYLVVCLLPFVPYFQGRKKEVPECEIAPDARVVHPSQP